MKRICVWLCFGGVCVYEVYEEDCVVLSFEEWVNKMMMLWLFLGFMEEVYLGGNVVFWEMVVRCFIVIKKWFYMFS